MKKNTSTLKKIFGYIGHYKYLLFFVRAAGRRVGGADPVCAHSYRLRH